MRNKKICVITGSRAEYGLLANLLKKLKKNKFFDLQIIVTGMHLSTEFGETYKEIENDGLKINKKIEVVLSSDTAESISKSIGLGFISFSEAYKDLKPHIVIILGDRYELLAPAFSALLNNIPIAHIHGGEVTTGAFDDAIRHSISKMSWLHFCSTEVYKKRLIQLGENPSAVFNVGGLGAENVNKINLIKKEKLEKELNIKLDKNFFLVTFHSTTLEKNTSKKYFQNLLNALNEFKDFKIIFTLPNSDTDGRVIIKLIKNFQSKHKERVYYFTSLGQTKYFSLIKYCKAVIGNSSSGLLEVPSFKIPTVNIGERQTGRVYAPSVINCLATKKSITLAIKKTFNKKFSSKLKNIKNPYYNGETSKKIINILKNKKIPQNLKKVFYDLDFNISKKK